MIDPIILTNLQKNLEELSKFFLHNIRHFQEHVIEVSSRLAKEDFNFPQEMKDRLQFEAKLEYKKTTPYKEHLIALIIAKKHEVLRFNVVKEQKALTDIFIKEKLPNAKKQQKFAEIFKHFNTNYAASRKAYLEEIDRNLQMLYKATPSWGKSLLTAEDRFARANAGLDVYLAMPRSGKTSHIKYGFLKSQSQMDQGLHRTEKYKALLTAAKTNFERDVILYALLQHNSPTMTQVVYEALGFPNKEMAIQHLEGYLAGELANDELLEEMSTIKNNKFFNNTKAEDWANKITPAKQKLIKPIKALVNDLHNLADNKKLATNPIHAIRQIVITNPKSLNQNKVSDEQKSAKLEKKS